MPLATCNDLIASKGTKVYVSASLPADYLIATYDTLSWTEVGMVESVPEMGPNASVGTYTPLGTGKVCKYLTTEDMGDLSISIAKTGDAGLAILEANERTGANIAFKIELSDMGAPGVGAAPTRYCFIGMVTGLPVSPGSVEGVVMVNPTIAGQSDSWATAAAVNGS
ncbi:MAG: hypothetical protein VBE63_15360 [Lamprobacter sp.]|uniref:hypothetical protein n=1 Tax=Lamprobacter sp. TaxID=3100796 RepID=UPI002B260EAC|nr:hypothetical protein [Lamprobacter sp.]MEA3641302.1 hypothetical protein [Lamprobacter sp.]